MEFVCPKVNILHEVDLSLSDYYNKHQASISGPPPIPLILNGWIYSTDYQKKLRWEETVKWAELNGCSNLIPCLNKDDKYNVDKIMPTFFQEENPYGSAEIKEGIDYFEDNEGLKHDIKERDPKFRNIIKLADKEAEEKVLKEFKGKHMFGECHSIWEEKKRILKEKYNIDWKTPVELNPDVQFD